MVGTWFANKRKDIKKRIEGESPHESPGHVLMNRRGRPPKHYYSSPALPPAERSGTPSSATLSDQSHSHNHSPNTPLGGGNAGGGGGGNQDPMCMAVELAAVNHSILALVGNNDDETSDDNGEISGLNIPNIKQEYESHLANKCQFQNG
ncbi:PREDICTED: homeobox-containing protein 1-like [Priapulus caudatus]|uniref:Homeobox-containing protein 1-like n=1 Tax=Priapulus caudatus TaxID=37621 RepID=A0ABM1E2M4_PRICU|nr:PREDICTED: homeobox-containing protein 1-like [Priapulus caudatus]